MPFFEGRRRTLLAKRSTGDVDALAWKAAVLAAGGPAPSAAAQLRVDTWIRGRKSNGTWTLIDDAWAPWGEDAIQSAISLKQRRQILPVNSPSFTALRGWQLDGTTQLLNTQFVYATHATATTQGNYRMASYELSNVGTSGCSLGVVGSTTTGTINMRARNATSQVQCNLSSNPNSLTFSGQTSSLGLTVVSRAGTPGKSWKNGVAFTDFAGVADSAGLTGIPATNPLALGAGAVVSPTLFRASLAGFAYVGAPLSGAQETVEWNDLHSWAQAIGADTFLASVAMTAERFIIMDGDGALAVMSDLLRPVRRQATTSTPDPVYIVNSRVVDDPVHPQDVRDYLGGLPTMALGDEGFPPELEFA